MHICVCGVSVCRCVFVYLYICLLEIGFDVLLLRLGLFRK